ncbi:MAG: HAMP domain-containing histidine kinase [Sphingosinicella sp.]|nr:HAMP domain-containing histidine kinase [Sphingosinicella sp.]
MKRPRPSLVRRLTIGFIVSNALAALLFVLVILYPGALLEDSEPVGPELPILLLESDLRLTRDSLSIRPDAEIVRFAQSHPGTWFVARKGSQEMRFGPVPSSFRAALDPSKGPFQARYRDLGAKGPAGDAMTAEVEIDDQIILVTSGGVISSAITFRQFLEYMWGTYMFWIPVFTAIFNVAGGLIAIPIVLRSVYSTARAAAELDPADPARRLPEYGVVKELGPIVSAFNAALDRLADALERRRRFIADVAHELRTPLAVLNMHTEDMPDGGKKPDLQRTVFRLSQMVGQMLDAERLLLAARVREPVDLIELARGAVAEIAPLAISNGYDVAVIAAESSVTVQGDPYAISRALSNLLGNAVAHGGGSGTVEVRIGKEGVVDVVDQGPGVANEARERIFEPFHRERWDKDGCGLGLHLVSEVMQAHGGSARLVGTGPGAIFRLEFPQS